ncbi:hypothetical protein AAC387_Pa09g2364 [Persea americana]
MPKKLNSRKKRKLRTATYPKKLRSDLPRRKRIPLIPIIDGSSNQLFEVEDTDFPSFQAPACSSTGEISCESSLISVGSENPKKRPRLKENKAIGGSRVELRADAHGLSRSDRPITRSYYKNARLESLIAERLSDENDRDFGRSDADSVVSLKQRTRSAPKAEEKDGKAISAATCSETSCLEPVFQENLKQKTRSCSGDEKSLQNQANAPSTDTRSEMSCIEPYFQKNSESNTSLGKGGGDSLQIQWNAGSSTGISDSSCLESLSVANAVNLNRDGAETESQFVVSGSAVNLACSEQLSNGDDDSEYSTCHEMTLSELEEEIFPKNSYGEYIDFSQQSTSSFFDESSDAFSERSDPNSSPSECFSLFLQYLQQFSSSITCLKFNASHGNEEEDYEDEFTLLRFEDEEHEESYRRFRSRERKQVFVNDYAKEYCMTTEYGNLVVQQRQMMVNWIVVHCGAYELQDETLFLSVSLLDRFLSRGFFTSKKNLQILGVACCTLATRIEENQPLNCVRQMTFQVGGNVYRRCEVVAMEWVVQEVLEFKCFMPTTYNFLWFYLTAARADEGIDDRTKYLARLSLFDPQCLRFWPSTVAAGLVILSSLASNRDSSCQHVMETHVRTKNDDLPECIQSLEWLVKYACSRRQERILQ